jgi:Rha family phage regulatory protein
MSDLSTVVNTKGMVSSRVVAEKFGKRHKNVLRAVRSIGDEFPSDFYRLNFEPLEKTGEILMSRGKAPFRRGGNAATTLNVL